MLLGFTLALCTQTHIHTLTKLQPTSSCAIAYICISDDLSFLNVTVEAVLAVNHRQALV
jgi:hypothetical protein